MKKLFCAALLAAAASAHGADYFVVVPVPGRTANVQVALASYALPTGVVGAAYDGFNFAQLLQVTGDPAFNPGQVTWSVTSGSLPSGLTLSGGVLAGTPQAAGSSTVTLKAVYKGKSGEQAYQLVTVAITVSLASANPPNAQVGAAYSYDLKPLLEVAGDPAFNPAGVAWSVVSSTLPAGLALRIDGTITGTPTAGGQGAVTVRATYRGKSGEQTYQLLTLNIVVTLQDTSLPVAQVGSSYSFDFRALAQVTGDPDYRPDALTWSMVGAPGGLSLSPAGVLSGTVPAFPDSGAPVSVTASYKDKSTQRTYTLAQERDPYWAQTVALLRMDGTPGSTTFVDLKGHAFTSFGAVLTESPAKFGESGVFPGGHGKGVVGPVINLPGDFTLEAWVNPAPAGLAAGYAGFLGQWNQLDPNGGYLIGLQNGNVAFSFNPYSSGKALLVGTALQANTWSHVAVTRQGSTFRMFINGSQVSTASFDAPGPTLNVPFGIGDYFDNTGKFGAGIGAESFTGLLDEVRVTAGVARYTANFTPARNPVPGR